MKKLSVPSRFYCNKKNHAQAYFKRNSTPSQAWTQIKQIVLQFYSPQSLQMQDKMSINCKTTCLKEEDNCLKIDADIKCLALLRHQFLASIYL